MVCAGTGADTLAGGPGDDLLDVGADTETDTIDYSDSDVGVSVDLAAGNAHGEGTDLLVLEGRTYLLGSYHDDVLLGTGDDDAFEALGGADQVEGRAGDDQIGDASGPADSRGGPGDDNLMVSVATEVKGQRVSGGGGHDALTLMVTRGARWTTSADGHIDLRIDDLTVRSRGASDTPSYVEWRPSCCPMAGGGSTAPGGRRT